VDVKNPNSNRINPFRKFYDSDAFINSPKHKAKNLIFPIMVDIELTNHCNLNCFFCGQIVMKREKGFMSKDIFTKIIDECKEHNTPIRLIRWGEPFLHKNIMDYCSYIKKNDLIVHITTNGLLLNESNIQFMVDQEIDSIKFSFQGATKEQYQEMRNTNKYDILKKNIHDLVNIRGSNDKPYIHISSTMTNETNEEIEEFIDYWKHIVDSVGVGKTNLSLIQINEISSPKIKKTVELLKSKESVKKEYRPCGEVYRKLSVDWDGKISCCCSDYDNHLTVGDINESTLKDAWKCDKLKAFRVILDHQMHKCLTRCSMCYHEYDHINTIRKN